MNKFILVFGLLTIGNFCFSQNNNIIIVDTSLRYIMHYGSIDYRWRKLSITPDYFPDSGMNIELSEVVFLNEKVNKILSHYVFEDDTYHGEPVCYYINRVSTNEQYDLLVVRYIPNPSSIDSCIGVMTKHNTLFFFQPSCEQYVIIGNRKRNFHLAKYPEIWIDAYFPIDYYLISDKSIYYYNEHTDYFELSH